MPPYESYVILMQILFLTSLVKPGPDIFVQDSKRKKKLHRS